MMPFSEIAHPDRGPVLLDADLALVQAAQQGDIASFEELVKRHERRMFRIAQNLLHNREDSQDAVQEAFLKAFRKLPTFQARSKFSTWLTRITMNEALTKLRKQPVESSSMDDDTQGEVDKVPREIADWSPSPETLCTGLELRAILEKNLRRLRPSLRMVFLLRDVEGLSLEETAQNLGLSVAAVKSRTLRARLQLREWLSRCFQNSREAY